MHICYVPPFGVLLLKHIFFYTYRFVRWLPEIKSDYNSRCRLGLASYDLELVAKIFWIEKFTDGHFIYVLYVHTFHLL